MVTFDELRNAMFDGLRAHADACTRTMTELDGIVRDFENGVCAATERAGWRGHTAGTANLELEETLRALRVAALDVRAVAAELDLAADELASCQARLFTEIHAALGEGFTVAGNPDGRFTVAEAVAPSAPRDDAQQAAVQGRADDYVRRIRQILDDATAADARHAAALARLDPAEVAAGDEAALRDASDDLERTFSAMGPERAAAWWTSLSTAEQREFLASFPHELGGVDGLPAAVRDEANRLALSARLAELGPLIADGTATSRQEREYENLRKLDGVLAADPRRPPEAPLMLLKFGSRSADGEVVLAVGNPDTAKNTVVQVPGANTTLKDSLPQQLTRLTKLQHYSDKLTSSPGDAAAVLWLDYDAPEVSLTGFSSALGPSRAQEGAAAFRRFVNGMRASGPAGQHLTVGGHSYGTDVIAYAAKDQPGGLDVDDIVFLGSPGVHMDDVDGLGHDPAHVFAGMSGDDMVAPFGMLVHERLPNDPDFGAAHLPTNPGGHYSYWNERAPEQPDVSLTAQANITMGRYGDLAVYRPDAPAGSP
jgi:hypothetical protein